MNSAEACRSLLEDIQGAFGATSARAMAGGGSLAELVRFIGPGQVSHVAKFQSAGPTLVDGHELEALRLKALQIRMVREQLPGFAPYCAEVLGEYHRGDSYAFVMPYYEGDTVAQRLLDGSDGVQELARLLEVLVGAGYAARLYAAPRAHFARVHVQRVRRRLDVVLRALPGVVREAQHFEINGRRTCHAGDLLDRLEAQPDLCAKLEPSALSIPLHGDAVLSNFIWHTSAARGVEFTAIDPRGTLEPWDPAYDFAKMFFSLCIYDEALADGFAIKTWPAPRGTCGVELRLNNERPNYRRAALTFFDTLASVKSFRRLPLSRERYWRERILFANAMHCLAFAACRLADGRVAEGEGSSPGQSKREGALGFYLAGVVFLGALLDAEESGITLQVDEYLNLLRRGETDGPFAPTLPGVSAAIVRPTAL